MGLDFLKLKATLGLDSSEYESGLKKAVNDAEAIGGGFSSIGQSLKASGKGLIEFGDRVSAVGDRLTNNITKPALNAAKSIASLVLGSGWERMATITEAKNKLHVLGVEGEELNKTMERIGETVDGTAFSTAQFANTAAQAVSMGYREGKGLEQYLQTVADLAAFSGRSVEDVSSITAKIASQNKLTGETFQQLSDSAVPVLQWIQEEYGVTAEEARKMVSDGKITFADYENMVKKHIDGMAREVGDSTLQGALQSTQAYIAKLGAAFLGSEEDAESFAGKLLPLVNKFNEWLVSMADKAAEWGAVVGEAFGAVIDYVMEGKANVEGLSEPAQELFNIAKAIIDVIKDIINAGRELYEILGPERTAKLIAAILLAGPVLSLIGGIAGAIGTVITVVGQLMTILPAIGTFLTGTMIPAIAGFVATFWPVILVVGAVIAIGVLLYKNWDTIKAKAIELASKVSEAWGKLKGAVSKAVEAVKGVGQSLVNHMKSIGNKVVNAFKSINWKSVGLNIIKGIANGLLGGNGIIIRAAVNAAKAAFNAAKRFLGIRSPSKLFRREIGENIGKGMALGLEDSIPVVSEAMSDLDSRVAVPSMEPSAVDSGSAVTTETETAWDVLNTDTNTPQTTNSGNRDLTVILELDRMQLGRAVYRLNNEETQRVGVNLAGGFA